MRSKGKRAGPKKLMHRAERARASAKKPARRVRRRDDKHELGLSLAALHRLDELTG